MTSRDIQITIIIIAICNFVALQKVLSRPILWVKLMAAAWVCAFLLRQALLVFVPGNPLGELILGNGSKGIVVGVLTGLGLKTLLSKPT